MPLLKRKAIKPVPPPNGEDFDEDTPVYMMRFTNEIFTNYEDYVNRFFFYQQKNWQCETTGKSGLTYEQALESEQKEKSMVANKFPPQLRKPLLEFVQFQTARIDAVVDDAFAKFKNVYYQNEPVNVLWGDKATYGAVILKVLPKEEWTTIQNGTEEPEEPEEPGQYLIQVLDQKGVGIEDMKRVVDCSVLSRDRLAFNKNILRKYIRECSTKENYIGAPWQVKASLAKKYGIETTLPDDLQTARDSAFSKLKKRKGPADPAPELAAAKRAKKEAAKDDKQAESATSTDPKVIKYPIEDLNLDAKLIAKENNGTVARPEAQKDTSIPQDCFESVVMVWQFLNSYSVPLKLSPFGMKDFVDSLTHTDDQHPSVMVAEYHSALMNIIIQDRLKGIAKPILLSGAGSATTAASIREDREGSVMTEDDESTVDDGDLSFSGHVGYVQRQKLPHRPINEQVIVVGRGWDEKLVAPPREGWEAALVGLINELGSFDAIPNVDRILNHLVPNETSQREDVEQLFPSLPYEDKVSILVFLVETAAGTSTIRLYIEECREGLKVLRMQKLEINKEKKQLQADWTEFDRQESIDNKNAALEKAELEQQRSTAATPEPSHDVDSEAESGPTNGELSRSESRQEKLRRQQLERELVESRRHQDLLRQRAFSKARSAEQKARYDTRKKLTDKENALNRKDEQIDRDMRRYAVARVKPLGKDRFFNRYWYFDSITMDHGTDQIYVQSPSFLDLETIRARPDKDKVLKRQKVEDPSGKLDELLKMQEREIEQGLIIERAAREKKLQMERERILDTDDEDDDKADVKESLANGNSRPHLSMAASAELHIDETTPVEHTRAWWSYYSEPEQVDALMQWLNNKGVRESALLEALTSHRDLIVGGMERRQQDLLHQLQKEQHRRSTRTKTVQASEGYMGYVNKLSK